MTLAEILGQVVLPSLAAMGAGIGGGLAYAKRGAAKPAEVRTPPQYRSLPPAAHQHVPPTQQAAPGNTGRFDLDGSLGAMRCDRHQAMEDAQQSREVEAREFRAEVRAELRHLRDEQATQHQVLSEVRDAVLRWETRPSQYTVGAVRGGMPR